MTPEQSSAIARYLKDSPAARDLAAAYERLRYELTERFDLTPPPEWERGDADEALTNFFFWWTWGN